MSERPATDNRELSTGRRRVERSDDDVAEAIGRMINAFGRRCAEADPDTGSLLRFLRDRLDEAYAVAVDGWRAAGITDAQIGRELGVTKQAVQKRWPRKPPRDAGTESL